MLQGSVAGFDQFSLALERGGQPQLVYKHAISTLQPDKVLNLTGEVSTDESTGMSTETPTDEPISESED
jgi:host factor-I protein